MVEQIIHDLNALSHPYILTQGNINLYSGRVTDVIEEYLTTLPTRIQYTVRYDYDYYEGIGYFSVAVFDTQRLGGDMRIFTYKYRGESDV